MGVTPSPRRGLEILKTTCTAVLTIAAFTAGGIANAAPEDDVRTVFEQYRKAVFESDGETVASLMSKEGIAYYQKLRDLALDGTREVLGQHLLVEQNQVLLMRVRMTREELERLSEGALVAHLADRGWISMPGGYQAGLGKVALADTEATGQAMIGAREGVMDYFRFAKEERGWRFDPTHTLERGEQSLKSMQANRDSEEFLMMLVRSIIGEPVNAQVWEPLRKNAT